MDPLREIFAQFDVAFNTSELENGAAAVDSLVGKLTMAAKLFAGFSVVKGIIGWGEHVAEAAREVEFGAIKAGLGTDEFQKLNQVAERYGTTAEQVTVSTRLFVRSLRDAGGTTADFHSRSKLAADAFHDLGINAAQFKGKSISEILPVLADGFQKIGKGTRATADALVLFGHRGIGILPLMLKGGENLRKELQAMQPIFEESTIEAADRATLSAKALGNSWEHLINNAFGAPLLDAMSKAADFLDKVVKGVDELVKHSEIGKAVLITLGATLVAAAVAAVVAWWPVLLPLAAVLAAFTAIALAVDDFIVFMEGGKSVTGRFFNELLGEGGAEKARKWFEEDLPKAFHAVVDYITGTAIPAMQRWLPSVEDVKNAFIRLGDDIRIVVTWIEKLIDAWERFRNLPGVKSAFDAAGRAVDFVADNGGGSAVGSTLLSMVPGGAALLAAGVGADAFTQGVGPASVSAPAGLNYTPAGPNMSVSQSFSVIGGNPEEVRQAAKQGAQDAINQHLRETMSSVGGAQ